MKGAVVLDNEEVRRSCSRYPKALLIGFDIYQFLVLDPATSSRRHPRCINPWGLSINK